MTPDRNKTALTHAATDTARVWMLDRGFKPVETEVYVGAGWIADLAGVITPTHTEMQDLRLIRRKPRWLFRDDQAPAYRMALEEWHRQAVAMPHLLTATVEIKTSRGDYRSDRKWENPLPTRLGVIAMPDGLVPQIRWPEGWGVLLLSEDCTKVKRWHPGPVNANVSPEMDAHFLLNLAVRGHNVHHYEHVREAHKRQRAAASVMRNNIRVGDAITLVLAIQSGIPVEEALRNRGIDPSALHEIALERLRKIAPQTPQPTAKE